MRQFFLLASLILAFSGAFYLDVSAQESAFDPGQKNYFITGADVRLRTSPGVDGQVIGNMEFGTPVTVLSRSEQPAEVGGIRDYWYEVKLSKGVHFWKNQNQTEVTGWVFGPYVNGFEGEEEFFDSRDRILDEKAPTPSALYQKLASYTWDQASALTYVPCFSGTVGLHLSTLRFQDYECGPVYRIVSMRDESSTAVVVNAALLRHCHGENYEATPFPVQTVTIRLETNSNYTELHAKEPQAEDGRDYLCYQSELMVKVNGTEVRYRDYANGDWLSENYSGNHEDYPVLGVWQPGTWLFLQESAQREETINGKRSDWYLVVPVDSQIRPVLTFGAYLKPVSVRELSTLPATGAGGEVWNVLSGRHWKGKAAVGDCEVIPHDRYVEMRMGANIRYYLFPNNAPEEGMFTPVPSSGAREGSITGYRIEWAADGSQKSSQFYMGVREESGSLILSNLPLVNEVVMKAAN